ncbi:uncharacterized protein LOC117785752 [Drosophila innubila]|uniref:uncharacterized protein LOC117785752 n=1 Tax=Drosophila innubila TaxID=198719 RepID=UPI00148C1581|nr:uncharacterized protein LOC117785752 [Drosophila innubila]
MYNESSQTHRCQSPQNDLLNTPEHLRPGFSGQPRQYDPREFGLTGNEQWQHPNMFRNMTYETDIGAMDTFRQAQPRRTEFCPPLAHNLGNLPEEHLADMTPPTFDLYDTDTTPLGDNEPNLYVDSLYQEIVNRFDELRERIAQGDNKLESEVSHASCNTSSKPNEVSEVCTSQNENGTKRTLRKVTTRRDQCGNVTSRVEETSTVSNGRLSNPNSVPPNSGRQLNFSLAQSENLADVSMPSFHDDSMIPAMSTRIAPQNMTSECLADKSAPPLSDSAERRLQTPARTIGNILAPSFGTNVCLEDVSAPSFAQSTMTSTRPGCPAIQDICEISAPSLASPNRGPINSECLTADSRRQATILPRECLENVTMPSFGGVSGASNRQMTNMPSECLEDVSAPSFGRSMSRSRSTRRQQRSMPSQNICDISAPSFGSSVRGQTTNECLEDMSMPSFGGVSGASRARAPTRQHQSVPSQNICDISAPSFGTSGREQPTSDSFGRQLTNQCLEDMSMPSFGGVSGVSRARSQRGQQRSMPTQNICDTSAPSFQSTGREPLSNECIDSIAMSSFGGVTGTSRRQQTMPSECLENITQPSIDISRAAQMTSECRENTTMPSFGGVTGSPQRQPDLPSECLDNITQPSFGRSMSRGTSQRQQDMSMAHQNIYNNPPYYVSQGNMPSECLEDVSAPSFGRSMSRSRTSRHQQRSMPSQNICDITAPSFESSGRTMATYQCLEDMSMPSFGGVSGASRARSPKHQERSMPTQNICDTSAPYFQNSGQGAITNECINNITMPSFGGVSGSSRRQRTMTSECLDDITQPSLGRSMPTQNIYDMTRECLDNVTMPSFEGVAGDSNRPMNHMPSECLEDVSAPSFGRSMSRSRSTRRQQRSMPSQNICDISAPSFGSSAQGQTTNQCLEDISMPSFGGLSSDSRSRSQRRQQRSMPTQNICDTSAPSFQSTRRGAATNEYLENMTMPSFGGVSGISRQQPNMPSECLEDITQPSFGRSTPHRAMEYSNSPYYDGPGNTTMINECLENVTMPSFGGVSGASNRQMTNLPSECLEDVSAPSFGRSMSRSRSTRRQQRSMPSQNICDISAPSFGNSVRGQTTNECLEDMSMPSFGGVSGASRARTPIRKHQSMPSQNICDTSAPSFGSSGREQPTSDSFGRPLTKQCLEDMSMPSFGGVSGVSRARSQRGQQRSMPTQNICDTSAPSFQTTGRRVMTNECLENITMPTFPERSLSQGASQRRYQRSMPSQYIYDVTEPSYYNSGRGPMTNECLNNTTMPSFGVAWRDQTMPNECLNDVSAPSMGRSQNTQQLWDISPPDFDSYNSYPRRPHSEPTYPSECLDDVTAPGLSMNMSMGPRSPHMTRAGLNDASVNSMRRVRSFPCIPSQQQIGDISAPSMSEICLSIQDSRVVRRETSHPNEILGNVSAPSYASNASRQNRPVGLQWADRTNISSMPSENLDNITEPTMLANNSTRGNLTSYNRSLSRPQEQLYEVSMPTLASTGQGRRNNFARSTAIGEDLGNAPEEIDSHFATGQQSTDSKDPPCQCPAAKQSMKLADNSNESQDLNGLQTADSVDPTTSLQNSTSNDKIARGLITTPTEQLSNECEPSALNNTTQGPSSGVTEVKEVTIIASVSSMTRKYTKQNTSECNDNTDRSRDRGRSVYHNVGNLSRNPENNETYHGFNSMSNYAPFDQLINCTPQTGAGAGAGTGLGACSPLSTPQPVRGNIGQRGNASNTLRSDDPTETRRKCCCNNKSCQRYRKTRQNQKGQDRNANVN